MKKLEDLVRPSILAFESYKSGRELYDQNTAKVLLDANESPHNQPLTAILTHCRERSRQHWHQ